MSAGSTTGYLHGYGSAEQQRLVAQAEHWRLDLIRDGTSLAPGTRLLEIGCGVGAVLAVLGQEFPGLHLWGVDISAEQLRVAERHLARSGVRATLIDADACALPFPAGFVDHVWMMWFLEHLPNPVTALSEARRVLAGGGTITAIEVDYSTCRADPSTPGIEALFAAMVAGMKVSGQSDAGTRLPGWLREAGFADVDDGERAFWWSGEELGRQANYAADVIEGVIPELAAVAGAPPQSLLSEGIRDLRRLATQAGAGLGWTVHKSVALK